MVDMGALFKRPTFELKFSELILAVACSFIVADQGPALTTAGVHVVFVAIHGYIAINIISILSYVMETHLHKYINVAIALSGAAMFFATGGLMIEAYNAVGQLLNYLMVGGVVAIVNGIFYLIDAFFSFREGVAST